jgi:Rod binding domain-containing protein
MYAGMEKALAASQNAALPKLQESKDAAQLREKTDAFEAIILKMLLDNAMKDEKNIFSSAKDPGDRIYKSMYRDELSRASAGSFGFSQMLFEYLQEKGSAS